MSSTPSAQAPAQRTVRHRRATLVAWLAGFALLGYALDQLTKYLVSSHMRLYQEIQVLPPLLKWHYITNGGAAFSFGENFTWVFSLVMAAVAVVIIIAATRVGSSWWAVALGMVLGGALGNLTDRLFRPPSFGQGHVVDFIAVPHFAIFNLADSAVVGGVILICVLTLLGVPFSGGRRRRSAPAAEGTE